MSDLAAMITAHPTPLSGINVDVFVLCVQQCSAFEQAAAMCADACAAESTNDPRLSRCAGACLNAADLAASVVRVVSRRHAWDPAVAAAVLSACVEACRACYDECRTHSLTREYCLVGGAAAQRCASACHRLLATLRRGRDSGSRA